MNEHVFLIIMCDQNILERYKTSVMESLENQTSFGGVYKIKEIKGQSGFKVHSATNSLTFVYNSKLEGVQFSGAVDNTDAVTLLERQIRILYKKFREDRLPNLVNQDHFEKYINK